MASVTVFRPGLGSAFKSMNPLLRRASPVVVAAACGSVCFLAASASAMPYRIGPANAPASLLQPVQGTAAVLNAADSRAPAGQPAAVKVSVDYDEARGYAFLMFRGLPEGFAFSTGFQVRNSWVASLRDASELKLIPPDNYEGEVGLTVLLVRGRDETVESREFRVVFGGQTVTRADPPVPEAEGNPSQLLTSAVPTALPEERAEPQPRQASAPAMNIPSELQIPEEEEARLLERAAGLIENGDIVSARLMFEHLARKGSGLGALALAQTYDPIFFRAMNTLGGLAADPDNARIWYEIAASLGQDEARNRLSALSAN